MTYIAGCLLLAFLAYQARGQAQVVWRSLAIWVIGASACGILAWSFLSCSLLPILGMLATPGGTRDWSACVVSSTIWPAFVALIALPFYGLLLAWYLMRFGHDADRVAPLLRSAALLALPRGVALLQGYTESLHDAVGPSLRRAFPEAFVGYIATVLALLLPRLALRSLAPGRLVRRTAA